MGGRWGREGRLFSPPCHPGVRLPARHRTRLAFSFLRAATGSVPLCNLTYASLPCFRTPSRIRRIRETLPAVPERRLFRTGTMLLLPSSLKQTSARCFAMLPPGYFAATSEISTRLEQAAQSLIWDAIELDSVGLGHGPPRTVCIVSRIACHNKPNTSSHNDDPGLLTPTSGRSPPEFLALHVPKPIPLALTINLTLMLIQNGRHVLRLVVGSLVIEPSLHKKLPKEVLQLLTQCLASEFCMPTPSVHPWHTSSKQQELSGASMTGCREREYNQYTFAAFPEESQKQLHRCSTTLERVARGEGKGRAGGRQGRAALAAASAAVAAAGCCSCCCLAVVASCLALLAIWCLLRCLWCLCVLFVCVVCVVCYLFGVCF